MMFLKGDKIVINADDFGLDEQACLGIVYAHKLGIINSVSVAVTRLDCIYLFLRKLESGSLSMGLHINLTEGIPLTKSYGGLDSKGHFLSAPVLLSPQINVDFSSLYAEMHAQIHRFKQIFRQMPTHLDSHQHFAYLHKNAFRALLIVSRETNIPIRAPFTFINEKTLSLFAKRLHARYRIALPFDVAKRARELFFILQEHPASLRTMKAILDIDFRQLSQHTWKKILQYEQENALEIICHPRLENGRFSL